MMKQSENQLNKVEDDLLWTEALPFMLFDKLMIAYPFWLLQIQTNIIHILTLISSPWKQSVTDITLHSFIFIM